MAAIHAAGTISKYVEAVEYQERQEQDDDDLNACNTAEPTSGRRSRKQEAQMVDTIPAMLAWLNAHRQMEFRSNISGLVPSCTVA